VGWGGPRKTNGSNQSIAIGPSPACPGCGDFSTGSTGQFWYIIFANGYFGALWFFGFFLYSLWVYRRDRSSLGQAGVLVVGLTFVYMLFYNSVPAALTITMISVGILWRSDLDRRKQQVAADLVAPTAIRPRATRVTRPSALRLD
jgi:hypothetical protein